MLEFRNQLSVTKTKFDDLVPHSNTMHPFLTYENEVERLRYVLAQMLPESISQNPQFQGFYNDVHVDEEWFELSEVCRKSSLPKVKPHITELANPVRIIMFFQC